MIVYPPRSVHLRSSRFSTLGKEVMKKYFAWIQISYLVSFTLILPDIRRKPISGNFFDIPVIAHEGEVVRKISCHVWEVFLTPFLGQNSSCSAIARSAPIWRISIIFFYLKINKHNLPVFLMRYGRKNNFKGSSERYIFVFSKTNLIFICSKKSKRIIPTVFELEHIFHFVFWQQFCHSAGSISKGHLETKITQIHTQKNSHAWSSKYKAKISKMDLFWFWKIIIHTHIHITTNILWVKVSQTKMSRETRGTLWGQSALNTKVVQQEKVVLWVKAMKTSNREHIIQSNCKWLLS